MNSFYPQDGQRDAGDIFNGTPSGSQSQGMNYQQAVGNLQQVNMEMLENLLMQDHAAGSNQHSQPPSNPQALLEHQVKMNQLQQLQQLQQQIFQQQLELLSGGPSIFPNVPPMIDRSRDTPQYGLPTPVSSTELRAQQNTDYVSPMLLHSSGNNMGHMVQNSAMLPSFIPQIPPHMLPSAPHSAPANLVFQSPGYPLPSPGELDLSELPPISSPMLDSYNNSATTLPPIDSSQNAGRSRSGTSGAKRPNASSSGDESSITSRPARKRPSHAERNSISGPSSSSTRKAAMRPTRSATSTPLFPPTVSSVRPSPAQRGMQGLGDIAGDTPSPVDPPMPPPAHPPSDAPLSALSGPSTSPTPPLPATPASPTAGGHPSQIQPVTPSQMFKLGRLGAGNTLASQPGTQDGMAAPKQREGKPNTRSSTGGPKAKAADKQLISPALKPIRPAGNAVMTPVPASPSTPFMQPQVRKSSHKAAEQKRRDSLKTSFDDLRILLPPIPLPSEDGYPDEPILPGAMPPRGPPKGNADGPNRGVSKLQLLRCGNEFIKVLKGRIDRRDEEIARLRQEVRRLRELVGDEAAAAPEGEGEDMIDLERNLDACEISGGVFGRLRAGSVGDGDFEDDGDA